MIEQNQLRVGNWIMDEDSIVRVAEIHAKHINHSQSLNCPYEDLEPIPLTPEILEKCGFDRHGNALIYSFRRSINTSDEICWYSQDKNIRYQTIASGFTRNMGVMFLHQLQNLFFALTGKELDVKI